MVTRRISPIWGSSVKDEIEQLLEDPLDPASHLHLSSKASLLNYLRLADEMRRFLNPGDDVLDWGCGLGHMSWLLERRGLAVTSYDIGRAPHEELIIDPDRIIVGEDPVILPFSSGTFDALLSCGVLEHVQDETGSLQEIKRVLKPGGFFFIYQLPQRYAYTELINSWRGLWHHPRRYTPRGIRRKLERLGFRVLQQRRANCLPKNLTGLPPLVRRAYNQLAGLVHLVDLGFSKVPPVNLLCHSIEIIAEVQEG